MDNYFENLEFDEESDYIISVIEDYERQGITTNVDFVKAEEEKEIILNKNNLENDKNNEEIVENKSNDEIAKL